MAERLVSKCINQYNKDKPDMGKKDNTYERLLHVFMLSFIILISQRTNKNYITMVWTLFYYFCKKWTRLSWQIFKLYFLKAGSFSTQVSFSPTLFPQKTSIGIHFHGAVPRTSLFRIFLKGQRVNHTWSSFFTQ